VITDLFAPTHLLLILIVALLVFGPKRLPEAGRSLGRGLRELRDGLSGHEPEQRSDDPAAPDPSRPAPR
jgi:sec-independent protein translocase protein TatA